MAATARRSARRSATAVVAILLALCATQAAARHPLMMMDSEWARADVTRLARSLLEYPAASCPAGFTAPKVEGTTLAPQTGAVLWSDLDDLGWAVPTARPTRTTINTAITAADFWSVNCNNWGRVDNTRTGCTDREGDPSVIDLFGATHMRYNCASKTLWILTYALDGLDFETTPDNMFAKTCPPGDDDGCRNAQGFKFVKYNGDASSGSCGQQGSTACSTTCDPVTGVCPWCCNDMWPITTDAGVWIGWMAQVNFSLNGTSAATYSEFTTHWNSAGSTVSTVTADQSGLCLNCSGLTTGEGDECPDVDVSVTAPTNTVACSSGRVAYEFTVITDAPSITYSTTTANCDAPVQSDTTVTVSCANTVLSCTLTATYQPEGTCPAVTDTATATATSATLPTSVNVVPDPTNSDGVCSTQGSIQLKYTVATVPDTLMSYVVIDSSPAGMACTSLQNGTSVASGTAITVTCQKDAGWPSPDFDVEVSATAGQPGCNLEGLVSTSIAVTPKPNVVVTPASVAALETCSDAPSVSFSMKVSNNGGSTAAMAVSAAVNATGLGTCTVAPNTDVANNTDVVVTCAADGDFTPGAYLVTVTASAGEGTCTDDGAALQTVIVNPKPDMAITGPTGQQICNAEQSVSYEYTITSGPFNVPATVTTYEKCSVTPNANVASGTTVIVTCHKNQTTGWPAILPLAITASAGTTGCQDSETLSAPVTVNVKPTVTVTPPAAVTTCANSGSVSLSVTASTTGTGNTMTLTATSSVDGVTCTTPTGSGATGTYTTTCSVASGSLPASFSVTFTATDGAAGCTDDDSQNLDVTTVCCATGSSYAQGTTAATPEHTATCFSTGLCGNSNWGWRNQLGNTTGPVTFNNIVGGGQGCKNTQNIIGTIDVTCANSGSNAVVTLGNLQQTIQPPSAAALLDQHYYVGCTTVTAPTCSPPRFGAAKTDTCNSSKKRCGGTAVLNTAITVQGCACKNIYWIFHQSAKGDASFTLGRDGDGQCPGV